MDKSLATFLRSLQSSRDSDDASRLLPSATSLLCRLSNPLNLTLLVSQLLQHDLLYPEPVNLVTCRQLFGVFYTAALRFIEDKTRQNLEVEGADLRSRLSEKEWIKAVIQGADAQNSPRWRHTLLIGGLLLAAQQPNHDGFSSNTKHKLEDALVIASNLALTEQKAGNNGVVCVVFVLNLVLSSLADSRQRQLNYDLLLPLLTDVVFLSREGLEHGFWLGEITPDLRQMNGQKLSWSSRSRSYGIIKEIKSRPLVSALGSLSKLMAITIERVQNPVLIRSSVDKVADFANNIATSWRHTRLSEVELNEEHFVLDDETLNISLPMLMTMLRDATFCIIIALRSTMGRLLCDPILASYPNASFVATQCLQILRDTYFISCRFNQTSSSQFQFVNHTAIDILNSYPPQAESFLASIKPITIGRTSPFAHDRNLDLFFLNTAEHFTLTLPKEISEELLFNAAMPYITSDSNLYGNELCEAAHSVILAVFAAPQNHDVAAKFLPFYVEALIQTFPRILNVRQFRLAIKSIIRIATPRSRIAMSMPMMQAVILELLSTRVHNSTEVALPSGKLTESEYGSDLSEKTACLLAIIDSLSSIPVRLLREWLYLTAELICSIQSPGQRDLCQSEFWKVLSNGEMDFEQAALCVSWWNTRGGRDLVLLGEQPDPEDFLMSGGLEHESKL